MVTTLEDLKEKIRLDLKEKIKEYAELKSFQEYIEELEE